MILKSRPDPTQIASSGYFMLKYCAKMLYLSLRHFELLSTKGVIWSTESEHFRREFGNFLKSLLCMFFLWQWPKIPRG